MFFFRRALIVFFGLSLTLSVSCGSSSSEPTPDTQSPDSGAPEVTDTKVEDQGASPEVDATPDQESGLDWVLNPDVLGPDAETQDMTPPNDTALDSTPGDATPVDATQPPDTNSNCAYVCNIDCQCKKDFDGCDIEECETDSCLQIMNQVDTLLAEAATGCTASSQCTTFEFPICGSFGCIQGPIVGTSDLTQISSTAQQGVDEQCSGFHCGCMLPEGPTACVQGSCVDCTNNPLCSDCQTLEDLIKEDAAFAATGCVVDDDCSLAIVDHCSMGPHIQCHAFAYATANGPGKVVALMSLFTDPALSCAFAQCDCQGSTVSCQAGSCVPGM